MSMIHGVDSLTSEELRNEFNSQNIHLLKDSLPLMDTLIVGCKKEFHKNHINEKSSIYSDPNKTLVIEYSEELPTCGSTSDRPHLDINVNNIEELKKYLLDKKFSKVVVEHLGDNFIACCHENGIVNESSAFYNTNAWNWIKNLTQYLEDNGEIWFELRADIKVPKSVEDVSTYRNYNIVSYLEKLNKLEMISNQLLEISKKIENFILKQGYSIKGLKHILHRKDLYFEVATKLRTNKNFKSLINELKTQLTLENKITQLEKEDILNILDLTNCSVDNSLKKLQEEANMLLKPTHSFIFDVTQEFKKRNMTLRGFINANKETGKSWMNSIYGEIIKNRQYPCYWLQFQFIKQEDNENTGEIYNDLHDLLEYSITHYYW